MRFLGQLCFVPSAKIRLGKQPSFSRCLFNIVLWGLCRSATELCCSNTFLHDPVLYGHNCDPLIIRSFDGTLGYEGEGPQWTLKSINVGSLEKNPQVLTQPCDALAIQETRVTAANKKGMVISANEANRDISFGPLMKYMESGHPEWGGVCIATNHGASRPFEIKEDASGLFLNLNASTRVHCVWTSVDVGKTMLLISFYGFSGAHQDPAKHVACDNLLKQVFEFVSQFGAIPVALCGDFQTIPHSYSSIRDLLASGRYHDPFLTTEGELDRPYTFCKNCKWHDPASSKTSIDGILVNDVAFGYIKTVSINHECGLQHAFCEIQFDFPSTKRMGFKWVPHAKLDISKLQPEPKRNQIASNLWEKKFYQKSVEAQDGETLAEVANDFCLQILLESGAKWNQGTRQRGTIPEFHFGNCDIQKGDANDANARCLNHLDKSLRRINDLMKKISIRPSSAHAVAIAEVCWRRIVNALKFNDFGEIPAEPTVDFLVEAWDFLASKRHSKALQIRRARIQTWKKKMQASAASTCKDLYHYLRMRHKAPAFAPVCKADGSPIYQPQQALAFAKEQWDGVFGVHAEGIPTQPFMNVIGPLLEASSESCNFPTLEAHDFYQAIQSRKKDAAAGIDGWRTDELQSLPSVAFLPWIWLWTKIENQEFQIPKIFRCARVVMLPKPDAKNHQPLSKRLITLLSPLYLAYTKVRFQQSISWQLKIFPKNLCGGVAKRKTTDISHHLAIRSEIAVATGKSLIGIKIDRSKCFDRIIPKIVASIGEKLGLDSKYLHVWQQLYCDFQRFLSYEQYIYPESLKSHNGIAQGDVGSVLGINLLMTAWCRLMSVFPDIQSFVYIDDAYLCTTLEHIDQLAAAIHATNLFDQLCGQAFNINKSCGWATCAKSRKKLKQTFPDLEIQDFVQVLGGHLKSSAKPHVLPATSKFHVIRTLINDIGFLPISFWAKMKLIATKVMPMITYVAELNPWSRKSVESFETNVCKALWGNRPHWRSSDLLFCVSGDPTKIHPASAIAKATICGIVNRCRTDPEFFQMWHELVASKKVIKKGLVDLLCGACAAIGIRFEPPFSLGFMDFPPVSFLDFTPKSLSRFLRASALQALYSAALRSPRKDFKQGGSGVFDPDINPFGRRWAQPWLFRKKPLDEEIFLGPFTGAMPTKDRLFKSGLSGDPHCRFCKHEHEDQEHLSSECQGITERIGSTKCPLQLQPNWDAHGIFEVPQFLINSTLQDGWSIPACELVFTDKRNITVWCDGSVVNGDHSFSRSLGAAVVSADGHILASHGWRDMWGESFKAEVVAIKLAVGLTEGKITIVTDCKSAIKVAAKIKQLGDVPDNIAHRDLWRSIFEAVGYGNESRLFLRWIKAHQVDSSQQFQFASHDQQMNKIADTEAKRRAFSCCPISPNIVESWRTHLWNKRKWLAELSSLVGQNQVTEQSEDLTPEYPKDCECEEAISNDHQSLKNRFVKWDWNLNRNVYTWTMGNDPWEPPKKWAYSRESWDVTLRFWQSLEWRTGEGVAMSIYEVSFVFWLKCRFIVPEVLNNSAGTFLLFPNWMRFFLREAKKLGISLFPPAITWQARKCTYLSATFPYGRFWGGRAFIADHHLIALADFITSIGSKASAQQWSRPLSCIP